MYHKWKLKYLPKRDGDSNAIQLPTVKLFFFFYTILWLWGTQHECITSDIPVHPFWWAIWVKHIISAHKGAGEQPAMKASCNKNHVNKLKRLLSTIKIILKSPTGTRRQWYFCLFACVYTCLLLPGVGWFLEAISYIWLYTVWHIVGNQSVVFLVGGKYKAKRWTENKSIRSWGSW